MEARLSFGDKHEIIYTYAADGRKLRAEYRINNFAVVDRDDEFGEMDDIGLPLSDVATFGLRDTMVVGGIIDLPNVPPFTTLTTRDYCGNYIYRNGTLERILTPTGYIEGDTLHHYIKDYVGNVRCVVRHDGTLIESNEYYPYGGLFSATASVQPNKYGAKELDRTNGLDLYDSEARWYDSLLGRTTTMDPLAEKYYSLSPYTWCAGNPVKFVDPDGNTISIIIEEGIYQYDYDNSSFVDSDGNIAQLDDVFFNQVLDALSILREGIVGNDLVKYISCNSGYNVFIKSSGTNGYNRQGANYSIDWNAELTEGGPSYFGIGNDYTRERPAYVGLGHEMAHVQDSWMGKVDDSIWYIANENTIVPKSEIYACSIENKIRAEHKIPMRTHYSYYDNKTVCPKSSLFTPFCTYYLLRRGK